MNRTRFIFLILIATLAAAAAWAHFRPADTISQSEGASAVDPSMSTKSSNDAPNAVTKSQVAWASPALAQHVNGARGRVPFDLSRRCYFVQNKAASLKSINDSCRKIPQKGSSEAQLTGCSTTIAENEAALQNINQELAECSTGQDAAKAFYEATKIAASQGNADAQACYVQFRFQNNGEDLKYSNQDIEEYLRNAPSYIKSGLSRGDWRIVSLLAQHGYGDTYNPLQLVTKNDVYRKYVMNRLLQLGAEGEYAQELERSIQADYLSPGTSSPPPLTQQQVADGMRAAQTLYHSSFDREPLLQAPPKICSSG